MALEGLTSMKGFGGNSISAPRVIVVSDVLLYREGLAASLRRDARLQVVAVANSQNILDVIAQQRPDAILLDGSMAHGLALARTVRSQRPDVRIVGFGIAGGAEQLIVCAESGLTAFVDCEGSITELVAAVERALRGELACSPQVAALMCDRLAALASSQHPGAQPLTRREHQVAMLISEGLSNKEIAMDLKIGPATVKNHVHNILEKLKVKRRTGIAVQLGTRRMEQGSSR